MMNELRKYPAFIKILKGLKIISLIFIIFITWAIIQTILQNKLYLRPICFSNSCLEEAYSQFEYVIKFILAMVSIFTSVLTTVGIFIAALTFANTSKTNALNSHINHFKIFSDYIAFEVSKRDEVKLASIDVFTWYNLIFENSKTGSIIVSKSYELAISQINDEISASNKQSTTATEGSYKYKDHQRRMIKVLSKIGISVQLTPRNDFIAIEGQFHDLIDTVNKAFCSGSLVKVMQERLYK